MSRAYTPGLEVSESTEITRVRELPLPGEVLVEVGDAVSATTAVLRAELPGELDIVRIADRLGLTPEQVAKGIKVKVGDQVLAGAALCEVSSFFGWVKSKVSAHHGGEIEFYTEANGHIGIRQPAIPLEVVAYLDGEIVATEATKSVTVFTKGALIQGIFGVGGERQGVIFSLDTARDAVVTPADLSSLKGKLQNAILIGGASFSSEALLLLREEGVQAVVTGSIDADTLRDFVGFEIGVSITGDEEVPFTLIVTEGFGSLALSERIVGLSKKLHGHQASVNGATQVRAGAIRPEVVVPKSGGRNEHSVGGDSGVGLEKGSRVRIIRVPYFGLFGEVTEMIHEPQLIDTGAHVRVVRVRIDGEGVGEGVGEVMVPRANIELV